MKREHIKLVILVFGLFIYPASNTVHADLIALWEFDNGSVADSYGYNHGILNGYPDFSAGHANIDGALELSGNDYLSISNESNFDITDKITVAAWIKVNEFNKHWQAIVTKGDSAWRLARTSLDKTLAFHLTGVTSDNNWTHQNLGVEGNIEVEDGKWHHAVGVYDGSKIYLYIDGILDKALNASGTIAINDYEVYIGENAEHKGRCFDGLIDDVAIFDHNIFQMNRHCLTWKIFIANEIILVRLLCIKKVGSTCFVDVHIEIANISAGLFCGVDFNRLAKSLRADIVGVSIKQPPEDVVPFAF